MLRWFPKFQVATACFLCGLPDLNFVDPYFTFMYMHSNHCHWATAYWQLNYYYYYKTHKTQLISTAVKHSDQDFPL
jgi:hypothetical protein